MTTYRVLTTQVWTVTAYYEVQANKTYKALDMVCMDKAGPPVGFEVTNIEHEGPELVNKLLKCGEWATCWTSDDSKSD